MCTTSEITWCHRAPSMRSDELNLNAVNCSAEGNVYVTSPVRILCRAYFSDPCRNKNYPQEDWISFSEHK